jgi:hypothetical protein
MMACCAQNEPLRRGLWRSQTLTSCPLGAGARSACHPTFVTRSGGNPGVRGEGITVVERRPPWRSDLRPEWSRLPVARFRCDPKSTLRTLFGRDRNRLFHRYELCPPSRSLETLLAELDCEPTGIFWGSPSPAQAGQRPPHAHGQSVQKAEQAGLPALHCRCCPRTLCGREGSERFEPGEPLSARSSLRARGPAVPLPVLAALCPPNEARVLARRPSRTARW